MAYSRTIWVNDSVPAINAENLNKIENQLEQNTNDIANIIESGSNDNGSWIKYSDGSMICYGNKDIADVSFTQLVAGINYSDTQIITFPQSFIDNPSTSISCKSSNIAWSSNVASSTSSFSFDILHSNNITRDIHCEWQAIGRWK